MTNAERQKRYRDKQRGGPPAGRWGGHLSTATIAKVQNVSRTSVFMVSWILRHAPDMAPLLEAGKAKTTPIYRKLRNQYFIGVTEALRRRPDRQDVRLVSSRKAGRFVFKWVKVK